MLDSLRHDIKYSVRSLRRAPSLSITVILLLSLGIGANTAIFSVFHELVLKSLPVEKPDELALFGHGKWVGINTGITGLSNDLYSEAQWREFRSDKTLFQDVTGIFSIYSIFQSLVQGSAVTEPIRTRLVTGNYFSLLGVRAAAGRLFTEAVDSPQNAHAEIVVSHAFAERRFPKIDDAIGKTVRIGKIVFTITGVSERRFFGTIIGESPDAWIPLSMMSSVPPFYDLHAEPMAQDLYLVARMRPGVSLAQASAASTLRLQNLLRTWNGAGTQPEDLQLIPRTRVEIIPIATGLAARAGRDKDLRDAFALPLELLMGVVTLILLIACANIGNLMMTRAIARTQEIGVRYAIGSSRWRILRQLWAESMILALLGGGMSVVFFVIGRQALVALASSGPSPIRLNATFDSQTLGLALLTSLCCVALFGCAPSISTSQMRPAAALRGGSGQIVNRRPLLGKILVVSQIALSFILLIACALLLQSFRNLDIVNPGFNKRAMVFSIDPASAGYKKDANVITLYQRLETRIAAVPGVLHSSLSSYAVNEGERSMGLAVEGHPEVIKSGNSSRVFVTGPQYLEASGVPLLSGRFYDSRDRMDTVKVGVINEMVAKSIFGNKSPIGKHFSLGDPVHGLDIEIIGVAGSARYAGVQEAAPWAVYIPYTQRPEYLRKLLAQVVGPVGATTEAVRRAIGEIDPSIPIVEATTMNEMIERTYKSQQMLSRLAVFFGVLALLIVAVGVYGQISFMVTCRTAEIGLRMALGAQRPQVTRLILREVLAQICLGALIGMPMALGCSYLMASLLFGVKPTDVETFVSIVILLTAIGAMAGLIPARRASRIDPLAALRYE